MATPRFLRNFDYTVVIQPQLLTRLLQAAVNSGLNANLVQLEAENTAKEKISQLLRPRFDLSTAFNPTLVWSPTGTYQANQLVELNGVPWVAGSYLVNAVVSYTDGNAYLCITAASNTDIPGTSAKWQLLGQQNALYYIPYPYPLFSLQHKLYNAGAKVYWPCSNYIAQQPSNPADHITELNDVRIRNVPPPNVFPNDINYGVQVWGVGTPYSVTGLIPSQVYPVWSAGSYSAGAIVLYQFQLWQALQNTSAIPGADIVNWQPVSWVYGDNRDSSLVQNMVDIALFHLYASISPQNIPDVRYKRYDKAVDWIHDAKSGEITPNIPLLQPDQGDPIRYGGNVKRNNTFF